MALLWGLCLMLDFFFYLRTSILICTLFSRPAPAAHQNNYFEVEDSVKYSEVVDSVHARTFPQKDGWNGRSRYSPDNHTFARPIWYKPCQFTIRVFSKKTQGFTFWLLNNYFCVTKWTGNNWFEKILLSNFKSNFPRASTHAFDWADHNTGKGV